MRVFALVALAFMAIEADDCGRDTAVATPPPTIPNPFVTLGQNGEGYNPTLKVYCDKERGNLIYYAYMGLDSSAISVVVGGCKE